MRVRKPEEVFAMEILGEFSTPTIDYVESIISNLFMLHVSLISSFRDFLLRYGVFLEVTDAQALAASLLAVRSTTITIRRHTINGLASDLNPSRVRRHWRQSVHRE